MMNQGSSNCPFILKLGFEVEDNIPHSQTPQQVGLESGLGLELVFRVCNARSGVKCLFFNIVSFSVQFSPCTTFLQNCLV